MAARNDSNGLLKFMTNATSSIQEAMGRQNKTKKVNHRKYLEKRLQKGPKKMKKPKVATTTASILSLCNNRQPVATYPPKSADYFQTSENEYDQLFKLVSPPPSVFPSHRAPVPTSCYGPPQSTLNDYQQQQEIETILSEFEADSPLQSLYSDSNSGRGSIELSGTCSSASFSMENTLVSFNDGYVYSPSDVSDFDESNFSSPRNPSPIYHSNNIAPSSPPEMYCHHQHNLTATYDCNIPTTGTAFASTTRPSGLSPLSSYDSSITDLLELVSTP